MWSVLALSLCLRGVVDQMDGGFAAVELHDQSLTFIPVDLLPTDTREGDQVVLHIRNKRLRPGRSRRAFPNLSRPHSERTASDRHSRSRRAQ